MDLTTDPIVICLTSSEDDHPNYVRPHMQLEMITVHGLAAKDSGHLSYSFSNGKSVIVHSGREIRNVRSVWYRKPKIYQEYVHVHEGYGKYAWSALKNHFDFIFPMLSDAFWVSDYWAIRRAGSKPWQLQKADALGFNIPDTLSTSDRQAAADFLAIHNQAVVKSPAVWGFQKDNDVLQFPTTRIKTDQHPNLDGLHLAPAIFQQIVEPKVELRVTVVGDEVFAASIHDVAAKGMPAAVRDWRFNYRYGASAFEPYELSGKIATQCARLVKELGLQYGAIDLIVDKKGKVWFLEINPNGQWSFIEEDTKLPIGKAIAKLLDEGGRDGL